jgi:uncharacterized membrane protein
MESNPHLVMAFFPNETAADDSAEVLKEWAKSHRRINLEAIGVLVKDEDGKVKTHKLGPRHGSKGIGIGAVLGVVAAIPTGGLSLVEGAALGGAGGGIVGSLFQRGLGLTDQDTARIAKHLDAGHAALGVLAPAQQVSAIAGQLTELGGSTEHHLVSESAVQEVTAATA